jgi:hypothetical protein
MNRWAPGYLLVRGFEQGPVNENLSLPGSSSLERVTGIEPALSAWESVPFGPIYDLTCGAMGPRATVSTP